MAESDQGEKTEEPTQQRREDFRKRGQVAQTKELSSVLVILSSLVAIWFLGKFFLYHLTEVFSLALGDFVVKSTRGDQFLPPFMYAVKKTLYLVAPLMIVLWIISFVSVVVQIGFLNNEEAFKVKLEKLNPVSGFKRIFSLKSLVEGVKAIFKMIIVGAIAALVVQSEIMTIPKLVNYSVPQVMIFLGEVVFKLFGGVGFFMTVLAGLDFLFQKWDLEKQMRMTKQEVKEEMKSREGDPLVKARIRRVQREMAQKRMMEDVPKADVIITNPTHIAIALRYSDQMIAPTVVAKGAGVIAERIKEIARKHNVPIVENKPLARTIFKTLDVGKMIPKELYTAVAEVLSYIYKLRRKKVY